MYIKKAKKIEVLKRARKILARPRGWSRYGWAYPNPGKDYEAYCLAAACQVAAREMGLFGGHLSIYSTEVADAVSLRTLVRDKGYDYVPAFNDAKGRKKHEVLGLIDERIAQLEAPK